MTKWEYTNETSAPGEDWYSMIRFKGIEGWEAWHIELSERGSRNVYFKRPMKKAAK